MNIRLRTAGRAAWAALALLIFSPASATAAELARADSLGIRDLLDVSTASISDLSPDGRWLAVTITTRRDGLGNDFSRDGDPTYLRSAPARVLVIDTRSGAGRDVWPVKKGVRAMT